MPLNHGFCVSIQVVALLLELSAHLESATDGLTPLCLAAEAGHLEVRAEGVLGWWVRHFSQDRKSCLLESLSIGDWKHLFVRKVCQRAEKVICFSDFQENMNTSNYC